MPSRKSQGARDPKGVLTLFDAPGACTTRAGAGGTGLTAIDPGGTVTGGIGLLV